ncbi:acetyl-CoA synthetase-like protein, partial [Aaosphaeria arxii CBS 175.79]
MSKYSSAYSSEKLIPRIIDDIARTHPDVLYAEIPNDAHSCQAGFRKITYKDLANAINGLALWIERTLGRGLNFETLVYLGPHDLRYILMLLAAVKAGYKMLFPSSQFAIQGILALIEKAAGKALLTPVCIPPTGAAIIEASQLSHYQIPELSDLLDVEHSTYAFEKSFEQARAEPFVVLHTSGSTGFPKPITWTHDWALSFGTEISLDAPEGYETMLNALPHFRALSMYPRFHAGHIFTCLLYPVFGGTVAIYPPSERPPGAAVALETLQATQTDLVFFGPLHVTELYNDSSLLDKISQHVKRISWAGGDITDTAGDAVNSKVLLMVGLGATEMGNWPTIRSKTWDPADWHYAQFHPAMNMVMEHREASIHEAVIKRRTEGHEQPIFKIYPHSDAYATGDMFVPHPKKPDLWRYYGRADDMLVFLSGEKFHPLGVENFLSHHEKIENALVMGTGKRSSILLIKLADGTSVDSIWPIIEEMNEQCPLVARVTRDRILVARPEKPFVVTPKGTVQRRATVELYSKELDRYM